MKAARVLRTTGSQLNIDQHDTADERNGLKKVRVFVRVRPCLQQEQNAGLSHAALYLTPGAPGSVSIGTGSGANSCYDFDGVLDENEDQSKVYETLNVGTMITSVLTGFNATLFAYGQTGSGKTHTIEGPQQSLHLLRQNVSAMTDRPSSQVTDTKCLNTNTTIDSGVAAYNHQGVIPRAIRDLFERIEQQQHNGIRDEFVVECSYLEIYNEEVFDLLSSSVSKGISQGKCGKMKKVRWSRQLGFHVPHLTRVTCTHADEALKQFRRGVKHKRMGSHRLNATSSRSHAIFSLHVRRTKIVIGDGKQNIDILTDSESENNSNDENRNQPKDASFENKLNDLGLETVSQLNLVDLAGSERLKQTGTTGRAKVESIQINKSLFVLRKVIKCLAAQSSSFPSSSRSILQVRAEAHIPYRESKLTTLLKHALGGNSLTLMIACLSPLDMHRDENVSTLRYAAMARAIVQRPQRNDNPALRFIRKLKAENLLLRQQLTHAHQMLRLQEGEIVNDILGTSSFSSASPPNKANKTSDQVVISSQELSGRGRNVQILAPESHTIDLDNDVADSKRRGAEVQKLKQTLVNNVAMIRKMFAVEQKLRCELDAAEENNGILIVENRKLMEGQEKLRERISILESVIVAEASEILAGASSPSRSEAVLHERQTKQKEVVEAKKCEEEMKKIDLTMLDVPGKSEAIFDISPKPKMLNYQHEKAREKSLTPTVPSLELNALSKPPLQKLASHPMVRVHSSPATRTKTNHSIISTRLLSPIKQTATQELQQGGLRVSRAHIMPSSFPLNTNQQKGFPARHGASLYAATLDGGHSHNVCSGDKFHSGSTAQSKLLTLRSTVATTMHGPHQRQYSASSASFALTSIAKGQKKPAEALSQLIKARRQRDVLHDSHSVNPTNKNVRTNSSNNKIRLKIQSKCANNARMSNFELGRRPIPRNKHGRKFVQDSSFVIGADNYDEYSDDDDGDSGSMLSVGDLQRLLMGDTNKIKKKIKRKNGGSRQRKAGGKNVGKINRKSVRRPK